VRDIFLYTYVKVIVFCRHGRDYTNLILWSTLLRLFPHAPCFTARNGKITVYFTRQIVAFCVKELRLFHRCNVRLRRLLRLRPRTIRCNKFHVVALHKTITLCNLWYDTGKVVHVLSTKSHVGVDALVKVLLNSARDRVRRSASGPGHFTRMGRVKFSYSYQKSSLDYMVVQTHSSVITLNTSSCLLSHMSE